jgi:hypothetical protein
MLGFILAFLNPKTYFFLQPKIGEAVFYLPSNNMPSDGMYVGPIISSQPQLLGYESIPYVSISCLSLGSGVPKCNTKTVTRIQKVSHQMKRMFPITGIILRFH